MAKLVTNTGQARRTEQAQHTPSKADESKHGAWRAKQVRRHGGEGKQWYMVLNEDKGIKTVCSKHAGRGSGARTRRCRRRTGRVSGERMRREGMGKKRENEEFSGWKVVGRR